MVCRQGEQSLFMVFRCTQGWFGGPPGFELFEINQDDATVKVAAEVRCCWRANG